MILATGSYSRSLPGLEIGGRVITSEHALELDFVPKKVAVLGGGVIGVEFASVWKSFGAEVTIIEALPHLVPNEEESISKQLERAFRKRGIEYKLGVRFQGVTQHDDGVVVTLENGETVEAELLLVAVGRGPVTQGLGYEEAGVTVDRGFVITNERLQTSVPGIYAVGDIVPGLQLAHRGFQQGIFVAEEIAGLNPIIVEDVNIPKVTYCEPEVASVGYTEARAAEKFGVADRWRALPGSAFDVDFGEGYDIVLIPNFFHHFDPPTNEKLMRKILAALNEGGRAITVEFVPNEDRMGPQPAATFALTMLATTAHGDAYTFAEYEKMFTNAGFSRSELIQPPMGIQQVIVSYK